MSEITESRGEKRKQDIETQDGTVIIDLTGPEENPNMSIGLDHSPRPIKRQKFTLAGTPFRSHYSPVAMPALSLPEALARGKFTLRAPRGTRLISYPDQVQYQQRRPCPDHQNQTVRPAPTPIDNEDGNELIKSAPRPDDDDKTTQAYVIRMAQSEEFVEYNYSWKYDSNKLLDLVVKKLQKELNFHLDRLSADEYGYFHELFQHANPDAKGKMWWWHNITHFTKTEPQQGVRWRICHNHIEILRRIRLDPYMHPSAYEGLIRDIINGEIYAVPYACHDHPISPYGNANFALSLPPVHVPIKATADVKAKSPLKGPVASLLGISG